ncbi:hypothetical protein AK89_06035 [Enterococcus mundtii CRL35]|nr:hypothetical protein AK89_06035 [Enterococcus mundtii CRL35]
MPFCNFLFFEVDDYWLKSKNKKLLEACRHSLEIHLLFPNPYARSKSNIPIKFGGKN